LNPPIRISFDMVISPVNSLLAMATGCYDIAHTWERKGLKRIYYILDLQ